MSSATPILIGFLNVGRTPKDNLTLPPDGVDDPAILIQVRGIVRRLQDAGCAARWMIVSAGEVVGLCSYLLPPENGRAAIGYGVAEKRRRLGHATRAVAAMILAAETDPQVQILTAETSINNGASSRVLEKNGFSRIGTRIDPGTGSLSYGLGPSGRARLCFFRDAFAPTRQRRFRKREHLLLSGVQIQKVGSLKEEPIVVHPSAPSA